MTGPPTFIDNLFPRGPLLRCTGGINAWYGTPSSSAPATAAPANGEMRLAAFPLAMRTVFDQIALEVTGAVAASTIRLLVYSDENGRPGNLLLNAGPVDGNSATVQAFNINLDLAPGLYWIGTLSLGGNPTIRTISSSIGMPICVGAAFAPSLQANCFPFTGLTSPPATAPIPTTSASSAPRVGLRCLQAT